MLTLTYSAGPNPTIAFDATGLPDHVTGRGFRKLRSVALPRDGAESLANLVRMEPGDRCYAIPVAPDTAFKIKTKTTTVSTDEEGGLNLLELGTEKLPSAAITDVELIDDKRTLRVETHRAKKRVTEWEVRDHHENVITTETSVSRACAEAKRIAKAAVVPQELHVRGVIVGEGSRNFATYRQKQTSRRVKIRITYVESTRRDPAPIGWLFFYVG